MEVFQLYHPALEIQKFFLALFLIYIYLLYPILFCVGCNIVKPCTCSTAGRVVRHPSLSFHLQVEQDEENEIQGGAGLVYPRPVEV